MVSDAFYGYPSEFLVFDGESELVVLGSEFESSNGLVFFPINDQDACLNGDEGNFEVGSRVNQRVSLQDGRGNEIAKGKVRLLKFGYLKDLHGGFTQVDVIEMNAAKVGYMTSAPLVPGLLYRHHWSSKIEDVANATEPVAPLTRVHHLENHVACFGPGTMITTDNGEVPVEWLDTSDRVLTRDHGFQPVLWVGRTKVTKGCSDTQGQGGLLCLPAGSLGAGSPTHDLFLAKDHRILLRSSLAQMLFSSSEVFAPANAWKDTGDAVPFVPASDFTLTHVLCAQHEVILAQGAWVESMFASPESVTCLAPRDQQCVAALLGPDGAQVQTARPCLTRKEATLLLGQQKVETAPREISTGLARTA